MFGAVIDTAIALIFIYLILSLLCSAVQEWLAQLFGLRANNLREGLSGLLSDTAALEILEHGVMRGLGGSGSLWNWARRRLGQDVPDLPTHLPSDRFVSAFMATLGRAAGNADELKAAVAAIPDPKLNQAASALLNDAGNDVDAFRKRLGAWFDESMQTVSAVYRRKVQWWLLGIGVAVAVAFNVDTLRVARVVFTNETLRTAIVDRAVTVVDETPDGQQPSLTTAEISEILKTLPIGWNCNAPPAPDAAGTRLLGFEASATCLSDPAIIWSLPGWLVTAIALSFGAPFWFDLLSFLVNVRGDGSQRRKPSPPSTA